MFNVFGYRLLAHVLVMKARAPGGQPTDDPNGGGIADHAVVVLGGYLYALGGTNGTISLASMERYSPESDKWEFMASMSIGRW